MKIDYQKFAGKLPYASESYGIYQPLLGWRSKLIQQRVSSGLDRARNRYLGDLAQRFRPRYELDAAAGPLEAQFSIALAEPAVPPVGAIASSLDSIVARRVSAEIRASGAGDPEQWQRFTTPEALESVLAESREDVLAEYEQVAQLQLPGDLAGSGGLDSGLLLSGILARESVAAGALAFANEAGDAAGLQSLLRAEAAVPSLGAVLGFLGLLDPARSDLARAVVSPIGLVHQFRQYFFELDSFLGPSVQHLWLSPGGTVELVEVSTRRTLVERATEQALESLEKSERASSDQDELSEAVRRENASSTRIGVGRSSQLGFGGIFVSGSTSSSSTLNLEANQKEAREQTHRGLRQQSEQLSSEIRSAFKSTFRTVTETTDVTSRRYTIRNTTGKLVNYELRRKMRQIGVQLQDAGTQLCWQTFVDDPGRELGIAELVHIAQPADLQGLQEPERPPQPEPEIAAPPVTLTGEWVSANIIRAGFIPFVARLAVVPPKPGYVYSRSEVIVLDGPHWWMRARPETADDIYIDFEGLPDSKAIQAARQAERAVTEKAVAEKRASSDVIQARRKIEEQLKQSGALPAIGGGDVELVDAGDGTTERSIKTVWVGVQAGGLKDDRRYAFTLKVTLFFRPGKKLLRDVADDYAKRVKDYSDEKSRRFQEALFREARERVTAASNVRPRRFEELREEERTVVYRSLIRQLLAVAGIADEDHQVRHVFSELVQSMFDVDRMLFFVAPEWWMPRFKPLESASPQDVGLDAEQQQAFTAREVTTWGGARGARPDNYYITETSTPARLGSSLGWLLQLDGDNLRNAFLNAPWVKAVIPILPGREWRALDWLRSDHIEGSDGLDALYEARDDAERQAIVDTLKSHAWDDPALAARYAGLGLAEITIVDAIRSLVVRIQARQRAEATTVADPDDSALAYLPTDRVVEHGFAPLEGGFRADPEDAVKNAFEVFDQWLELLPTDQIVPVEVAYDPKTGMQV